MDNAEHSQTANPHSPRGIRTTGTKLGKWWMLGLSTVGFALNFWAWALIGPLGPAYGRELGLSGFQQSVIVSVPVVVGSLGRVPAGALTDRFGARLLFPLVTALTIIPVLYIGLGADSYWALVVGGFFLGLGGTTFAIGVPLVNGWFPPASRGLALGIFGVGTGGTAIASFTTVQLSDNFSRSTPFVLVAVLLAVYAVVAAVLLRDPRTRSAKGSFVSRTVSTLRLPATWALSALYAVSFGGFVAFSVYLPTTLRNEYQLSTSDAAARTAVFVVVAVLARPVGGWLSDKLGPIPVLVVCFVVAALCALLIGWRRMDLVPVPTIGYFGLAATLGAASGGVFALVGKVVPAAEVGSVTGIVGAAGGLGGFFPPLVMGALWDAFGSYRIGLLLLAGVAAVAAVVTWWPMQREARAGSG